MAHLVGSIVTEDEGFQKAVSRMLRSGAVPVSIADGSSSLAAAPDVIIVDIRGDAHAGMASIERQRAAAPSSGVFAIASTADPDLILQAMRAGANEFFIWPPAEDTFYGAIRRTAARRE